MGNLGKAIAKVEFFERCSNINSKPNWQTFDMCGAQFKFLVNNSKEGKSQNIRFINDGDWCCMMPSEYKTEIDNYLKIGQQNKDYGLEESKTQRDEKSPTRLEWSVNGMRDLLTTASTTNGYDFWQKKFKTTDDLKMVSSVLPKWSTTSIPKQKPKVASTTSAENEETTKSTVTTSKPDMAWKIEQKVVDPGIVWGAQTNLKFGAVPYYIEVTTAGRQTKDTGISDFILIRINPGTTTNSAIDIVCQDSKIYIGDWNTGKDIYYDADKTPIELADKQDSAGSNTIKGPAYIDTGLKYVSKSNAILNLGILPCIGKLVIFSDDLYFVYNRFGIETVTDGTETPIQPIPFVLKSDTINVFGSNCTATVCISAMEVEAEGVAFPEIYGAATYGSADRNKKFGIYKLPNSDATSKIEDLSVDYPRYYLFRGNKGDLCTGASCNMWGTKSLESTMAALTKMHNPPRGTITVTWEVSKVKPTWKVMKIKMVPENMSQKKAANDSASSSDFTLGKNTVLKSGIPFLYRLRGYYDGAEAVTANTAVLLTSSNVISINHRYECQEVYSASQSVDITLYYDDTLNETSGIDLKNKSYGIKIYLSWIKSDAVISTPFFTGVTLDTSFSEVAGKETVTIHCEDYMRVLADNVILNSPFYDGQDWFDSIVDIATMGGITVVKDDTDETNRYYLPSGYSFQEPKMKFPQNQTLKDCITNITQLCEKIVYFNALGELHCSYLQGGLAFSGAGITIGDDFKFYRDPSKNDANIILDEKKLEKLIGSSVNQIFVTSIDRASGQPLVVSHVADKAMPWNNDYETITDGVIPPYKKILFYEQNAFGNLEATQNWVAMMAERVYKVPSRISFKTTASNIISPLSFIMVDGKKFRTTSFNRSYNAEDNSLVTTVAAEWLGDPDSQ